jgi:hypothetical protein
MSDQNPNPPGPEHEPDMPQAPATPVAEDPQGTVAPEESAPVQAEAVATEEDVPHGASGENPADASPEAANPTPVTPSSSTQETETTPSVDTSNEESTDGNS